MSASSPTSVITASAVFGTFWLVSSWASRSSAQVTPLRSFFAPHGASCTNRNGNSPSFQSSRQFLIMAGNSVRYWYARPAFDSPWYQIAPLMAYGSSGWIMPLYSVEGLFGFFDGCAGGAGGGGISLPSSFAFTTASRYLSSCST